MWWMVMVFAGERPGVILADPEHPLVLACTEAVGDKRMTGCVERLARRDEPAAEVKACIELSDEKMIQACTERLERRRKHDASGTINGCATHFDDLKLDCVVRTEEALTGLGSTIEACTEAFGDDKDGLVCVERFVLNKVDSGAGIRACVDRMGDLADKCVERIATARAPMENVIEECSAGAADAKEALGCVSTFTGARVDPAPGIRACDTVFSELRPKCLQQVARAEATLENVIPACLEVYGTQDEALKCVERFQTARADEGAAILACRDHMPERYRDECITRLGIAAAPMEGVVEQCGTHLPEKHAMKCVAMLVERRKAKAASVGLCLTMFDEVGDQMRCIEIAHAKAPAKLEKCQDLGSVRERMACVD